MTPVFARPSTLRALVAASLFAACLVPIVASAQTADEVVEKHLAALGGREALSKLTSRKVTGTASLTTPMGELTGTVETWQKAPNKSRTFMQLDLTSLGAGMMSVDQRFDGNVGFVSNTMTGNVDLTGSAADGLKNNLFPHNLLDYKARGTKVELQPSQKYNGKDAIVMLVSPKAGPPTTVFFDPDTYLVMKTTTMVDIPQMGQAEQTSELSDYRTVDGVKVAFVSKNSTAAQAVTIKVTKVEHNIPMDDSIFTKPAGTR
jgi:outer membrane lipoprotein-sorting protein